jgi:hypothetical protein
MAAFLRSLSLFGFWFLVGWPHAAVALCLGLDIPHGRSERNAFSQNGQGFLKYG